MNTFGRKIAASPPMPRSNSIISMKLMQRFLALPISIILLGGTALYLRGSPLVDYLPPFWRIGIFTLGVSIGAAFSVVSYLSGNYVGKKIAIFLFIPYVCGFAFTLEVSGAVELYAFSDLIPQRTQILAPIVGQALCGRRGTLGVSSILVQPYPTSRQIKIAVDEQFCEKSGRITADHYACLLLDVDTGRNSIRRVNSSIFYPVGEDRLRRCPA